MSFDPFDRCFDRDDAGVLVVLGPTGSTAESFHMADDITVADVYPQYPHDDEVYQLAYEVALDSVLDGWRSVDPDALLGVVSDFSPEVKCYYPESKLEPHPAGNYTETCDGVRCENCRAVVDSTAAWVGHVVTECREVLS